MFDIEEYLREKREAAITALDAALPAAGTRPTGLTEAMRYAVFSGGKRLRPILCMAAAEATGASPAMALAPAAAVELLHTYTLVHDDLPCMDDDDERRGRPTVHKVYGDGMAVLAGDALQALAFETLANAKASAAPRAAMLLELSRAAGWLGVVGGQWEDIGDATHPTPETVEFVHQHKTADLFIAAVRMGAIAGASAPHLLERLTSFGSALGRAFQVMDDLLDAAETHPAQELTCLSVMSVDEAREQAATLTTAAMSAIEPLGPPAEPMREIAAKLLNRHY